MRTMISIIVAVLALTVQGLGHAEEAKTNHWANLRVTQDFNSKKIAKLAPNTWVEILEEVNEFVFVRHGKVKGWIRKEYITKPQPVLQVEEPATDVIEAVIQKRGFLDSAREISNTQLDVLFQTITKPWITFSVTSKDEECLARNIYFESGAESEEGKVAVGIVTINRVIDGGFGKTICSVVNQRTMFVRSTVVPTTEYVQTGLFGGTEAVTKNRTVISYIPVCQFSWVCAFVRVPRISNPAWEESQRVARELLKDGYHEYREKYAGALYFHSTGVRPQWARHKNSIAKIGGHIFYSDRI